MQPNRMMLTLIAAIATTFAAKSAHADGLIRKLPEDATWATFQVEGYKEKSDQRKEPFAGWLRMSSVGSATEDGQPCRWIEFDNTYAKGGRPERRSIDKLLIPERHLVVGETPGEHIVRGWTRFDQPEQGNVRASEKLDGRPFAGQAWVYLVGPAVDEKKLDPLKIDHKKLGEITCERRTGTFRSKLPHPNGPLEVSGTFEARLHERAPFGIVRYEVNMREPGGREMKVTLSLDDFGPTAVSSLPDQK